jgi:hypothetical protein
MAIPNDSISAMVNLSVANDAAREAAHPAVGDSNTRVLCAAIAAIGRGLVAIAYAMVACAMIWRETKKGM